MGTQETEDDSILYELLVYSEWSQEQDLTGTRAGEKPLSWKRWASSFYKGASAANHIGRLVNLQLPWTFAVGSEGKAVAVLQDTSLEIRTSRDEYATPIGRATVQKDLFPQWRRLRWSPDGNFLACAHSNGLIEVFDLLASPLFQIPAPDAELDQTGLPPRAVAELVFVDTRTQNSHWSYELLCIDYHGQLTAYYISLTEGFSPSHSFSFTSKLAHGVTSVAVDHLQQSVLVASPTTSELSPGSKGKSLGLTLWRIVNDSPYYMEVALIGEDKTSLRGYWLRKNTFDSTVFKMSLSPDSTQVAAIHLSGLISLWTFPSLKLKRFWPLTSQPGFDELSPALLELPAKRRARNSLFQNPNRFHPVDLSWWSPEALILARCSGAVSVCDTENLQNKLGSSAEFFDGTPRISPAFESTFLGLECEARVMRKRALAVTPTNDDHQGHTEDADVGESSDEEGAANLVSQGSKAVRSVLYWVTDSERFQPPRKKPKVMSRTYRLLGFKRTTPEELYMRKLDAEEYGEALALARVYGLDCDLVYQRQWRNSTATIPAIHDYLSKVSKRSWVLRECIERVPDDIDAARELLVYGLGKTDLKAVAEAGAIPVQRIRTPDDDDEDDAESRAKRQEEHRRRLLAVIDFSNLTVEQKQLISTRRRLLQFLDRLSIYEIILGGLHVAGQSFDPKFFHKFRALSALESAAEFARKNQWQAVAALLTFCGSETQPHRLAICSCFPETVAPFEYRSILPECDVQGEVFLWEEQTLRSPDWSEVARCRAAVNEEEIRQAEAVESFYSAENSLSRYRCIDNQLDSSIVGLWYADRCSEIEKRSMLVENALDLVKLGRERNVSGLDEIYHQLLTLETLVYDIQVEEISLKKLQAMSPLEVVQLLMSKSAELNNFVQLFHKFVLPFLNRLGSLQSGAKERVLREYLIGLSGDDLSWALEIFDKSRPENGDPIIEDSSELINLALDCIYACKKNDQLEIAMKIYDCLPQRPPISLLTKQLEILHDKLDLLQSHLEAADTLEHHGVSLTIESIAAKQNDPEQAEQLFVRLTRTVVRKSHQFTEQQWKEILDDMLELQRKVFHCVSPQLCYEILVGSLLTCGSKESITWASQMLLLDPRNGNPTKLIPYERSRELILQAAQEYFNSAERPTDPFLELANHCLNLVTINDPLVQREKDLIAALQMLHDYGIELPPLKLRLSQNRLVFIEQVLSEQSKAYKNPSRLLRLGHLLRVCGENDLDMKARVYILVAETALKKEDFEAACKACNTMRTSDYSLGWTTCQKVALCENYKDLQARIDLLSFALLYCPSDNIEELLEAQLLLKGRLTRQMCRNRREMFTFQDIDEEVSSFIEDVPVEPRQDRLPSTQQLVRAVLGMRDGQKPSAETCTANWDCNKFGMPAFYASLMPNDVHLSCLAASYKSYSLPDVPKPELELLIHRWRQEVLATDDPNHRILLRLAEYIFSEDIALSLGHLLDMGNPPEAWQCFVRLPSTEVTLQCAAYFFALNIQVRLKRDGVFQADPRRLIEESFTLELEGELQEWLQLLQKSLKLLGDVSEARQLRRLDSGVDIDRFTSDDDYKRDTIVGLAITTDATVYSAALRLAAQYNVPHWEVAFSHLTALFAEESINPADLKDRLHKLGLMGILQQDPDKLAEKMKGTVYLSISGKDHARLMLYFELIKSNPVLLKVAKPQAEISLQILRKLANFDSPVDLKKLCRSGGDFIQQVWPLLSGENVSSLAKLADLVSSLDPEGSSAIRAGALYAAWAHKFVLMLGDEKRTNKEWLHRFESCKDYVNRMAVNDYLNFIDGLCFSDEAIGAMTVQVRHEICRRAFKLSRQQSAKEPPTSAWTQAKAQLHKWVNHLERLASEDYLKVRQDSPVNLDPYWRQYEASKGEESSLHRLLLHVLIKEQSMEFVQLLISVFPPEFSSSPEDILVEAVRASVDRLRQCDSENTDRKGDLFSESDPVDVLRMLLEKVEPLSRDGLVSEGDVETLVRSLCDDEAVDIGVRLKVLSALPAALVAGESGAKVQILRTLALLQRTWPQLSALSERLRLRGEEELLDEDKRLDIFNEVLEKSPNEDQLATLAQLLLYWPPFTTRATDHSHPWIRLFGRALASCSGETMLRIITEAVKEEAALPRECIVELDKLLRGSSSSLKLRLHLCLKSELPELVDDVFRGLEQAEQISSADWDDEIIELVIERRLVGRIASTPLYKAVCEHLLSLPEADPAIDTAVSQLSTCGRLVQGGSLLQMARAIPRQLQTFSSAFYLAKKHADRHGH